MEWITKSLARIGLPEKLAFRSVRAKSYREVLILYSLAINAGHSHETFVQTFKEELTLRGGFIFADVEWAYPVWRILPLAVNWKRILTYVPDTAARFYTNFYVLKSYLSEDEYLEALRFITNIDCLEERTGAAIPFINRRPLNPYICSILIDVHYLESPVYSPAAGNFVNAYPNMKARVPGGPAYCPIGEARDRLRAFTKGVLESPINQNYRGVNPFTLPGVIIAGGSIAAILRPDSYSVPEVWEHSDVDIFMFGPYPVQEMNCIALVNWFAGPNTYYAVGGPVITVYVAGLGRTFQIVSRNCSSPGEIIYDFDLSSCHFFYGPNGRFFTTPVGYETGRTGKCEIVNRRTSAYRFAKALLRGYTLDLTCAFPGAYDMRDELMALGYPESVLQKIRNSYRIPAGGAPSVEEVSRNTRGVMATQDPMEAADRMAIQDGVGGICTAWSLFAADYDSPKVYRTCTFTSLGMGPGYIACTPLSPEFDSWYRSAGFADDPKIYVREGTDVPAGSKFTANVRIALSDDGPRLVAETVYTRKEY